MSFIPSSNTLNTATNRWFAQRYNVNNAWNFNGTNGNLNNNNVYNSNSVRAVSKLTQNITTKMETKEEMFRRLVGLYYETRKNKRNGKDSIAYEMDWLTNLYRDVLKREERSFRLDSNYAFLVSRPKWREIFATCFDGRLSDHELHHILEPLLEKELSSRTYNNRKGKGGMAAMNQVMEDIFEVSEGYTKEAWIIKVDVKGFFPNARWDVAEKLICDTLDKYLEDEDMKAYYKWLAMVSINANVAAHCERRTPIALWQEHIAPDKSIFSKLEGVGGAIGRLLWQMAMGLYLNDEVRWLNEYCQFRAVCFVDDIVIVVPADRKQYALEAVGELRRRIGKKGLQLNEKKFYCQPYWHGLEFLGSHIKPHRYHLNNTTYGNAIDRIKLFNAMADKRENLEHFISSVNSYTGLLKNRQDYGRMMKLVGMIDEEWWKYAEWDAARHCVVTRDGYKHKQLLAKKYHIKSKQKHGRKHHHHGRAGAAA